MCVLVLAVRAADSAPPPATSGRMAKRSRRHGDPPRSRSPHTPKIDERHAVAMCACVDDVSKRCDSPVARVPTPPTTLGSTAMTTTVMRVWLGVT